MYKEWVILTLSSLGSHEDYLSFSKSLSQGRILINITVRCGDNHFQIPERDLVFMGSPRGQDQIIGYKEQTQ